MSASAQAPPNKNNIERIITLSFPKSIENSKKRELLSNLNEELGEFGKNNENEYDIKTTGLKNFYTAMAIVKRFIVENIAFSISFRIIDDKNKRGGSSDSDYEYDYE